MYIILQEHQQDPEDLDVINYLNDVSMCSENSVNLNVILSRSELVQSTKQVEDKDIQTDLCTSDQPNLRINCQICTDRIKATCSEIQTKCEVSVEVARLAVKIVMTWLYDYDAYLNIKEATGATDSSSTTSDKSQNKTYDYSYVLPYARTPNDYKQ